MTRKEAGDPRPLSSCTPQPWAESTIGGLAVLVPPVAGVAFTARSGGVSEAPYDTLNLSTATGDDPGRVAANRRRVSVALGISPDWATARQVHGCAVSLAGAMPSTEPPDADALLVAEPDRPVALLFADCVPVALTAPGVAGAVHAGWRGLCAGVVDAAVTRGRPLAGGPLTAWIGPCIGPCCFEAGPEVAAAFAAGHPGAGDFERTVRGRRHFDLPGAVAAVLAGAGVAVGATAGVCTACDPRFFSHRRDARAGGTTGRQGLVVWRVRS